jgi:type I restriction enzyme, S subunit
MHKVKVSTESYQFGDLFHLKHGFAFKSQYFTSKGEHIVVTPGNFYDEGGFKEKGEKEKRYEGPIPDGYTLKKGDLIVAMTEQMYGLLGSSAIIPKDKVYLHNQRLGLIENLNEKELNKKFLYYLFNTKTVRDQIQSTANGAKVRHTSPSKIYEVKIDLPKIEYQNQVADILSNYDNLIENNFRRIAILEETAQSLYSEWFVKFRFPDYEKTKFIDSSLGKIPEGWKVNKLKDICHLTMGQSPKSEFYNEIGKGLPFFQGVKDFGRRFPTVRVWCSKPTRLAENGDVLFSVRAPVGRLNLADQKVAIGRGLCAIRDINGMQSFLYQQLKSIFTSEDMIGNGAIFASVTKKDMEDIYLISPQDAHVEEFCRNVDPIFDQLDKLSKKNEVLKSQRDLLLPKLISGTITLN